MQQGQQETQAQAAPALQRDTMHLRAQYAQHILARWLLAARENARLNNPARCMDTCLRRIRAPIHPNNAPWRSHRLLTPADRGRPVVGDRQWRDPDEDAECRTGARELADLLPERSAPFVIIADKSPFPRDDDDAACIR